MHSGKTITAWLKTYADLGWKVFPVHRPVDFMGEAICTCGSLDCRNTGKHPAYSGYAETAMQRGSDFRYLKWTWEERQDHRRRGAWNIGLLTGKASGVWVLDVDVKPADGIRGDLSLAKLVEQHGPLPRTVKAASGSRTGEHYFFKWDDRIKPDLTGGLGKGLDVLADGKKLVVLEPSLHKSGERYVFYEGKDPLSLPVAPAPEWLIEKLVAVQDARALRSAPRRIASPDSTGWCEGGDGAEILAAMRDYNLANDESDTWPTRRGRCPICGSPDGFILLSGGGPVTSPLWDCHSQRHQELADRVGYTVGVRNVDGSFHGSQVHLDAAREGNRVRAHLVASGYLR